MYSQKESSFKTTKLYLYPPYNTQAGVDELDLTLICNLSVAEFLDMLKDLYPAVCFKTSEVLVIVDGLSSDEIKMSAKYISLMPALGGG